MNVYNIYYENGDMYTCAGKDESDAIKDLVSLYPTLAGADIRIVELNEAFTNEGSD